MEPDTMAPNGETIKQYLDQGLLVCDGMKRARSLKGEVNDPQMVALGEACIDEQHWRRLAEGRQLF